MARVGGAKGFWDTIKSVSIAEIAREANKPLSVAVAGRPEQREAVLEALMCAPPDGGRATAGLRALPGTPFVQGFDSLAEQAGFPRDPALFDIVIDAGAGREGAPDGARIYSVPELGGWDETLGRILSDRPELALALARNFPMFRRQVAQDAIVQAAVTNAQFALITGVTEAIPIAAILLPVNSLSDILVLTKNQVMMTLRLAAAYGLPVDYRSRVKEITPILANAFGWRAIARELVGAVPGVGFLARATIAYAGTITVGKAAQLYYETGETITGAQARRIYKEAYLASRARVRALARRLRTRTAAARARNRARSAAIEAKSLPAISQTAPAGDPPDIEAPGDS